jgi:hypothetical protein
MNSSTVVKEVVGVFVTFRAPLHQPIHNLTGEPNRFLMRRLVHHHNITQQRAFDMRTSLCHCLVTLLEKNEMQPLLKTGFLHFSFTYRQWLWYIKYMNGS